MRAKVIAIKAYDLEDCIPDSTTKEEVFNRPQQVYKYNRFHLDKPNFKELTKSLKQLQNGVVYSIDRLKITGEHRELTNYSFQKELFGYEKELFGYELETSYLRFKEAVVKVAPNKIMVVAVHLSDGMIPKIDYTKEFARYYYEIGDVDIAVKLITF